VFEVPIGDAPQTPAEVAPGGTQEKPGRSGLSQPPEDQDQQVDKALQDAGTRLQKAQQELRAAQAAYDKAKAAKGSAVWAAAYRQQLESLDWVFLEASVANKTIRVMTSSDYTKDLRGRDVREPDLLNTTFLTLPLGKDFEVLMDGRNGDITALQLGMPVSLRLADGRPEVSRIEARALKPTPTYVLRAVDIKKHTISVMIGGRVSLDGLPADAARLEFTEEDGTFEDLRPGMRVGLTLSAQDGQLVVRRIVATK
jgi:hypothetical protein